MTNNLCGSDTEKICIETKRVFDACIQRRSIENIHLIVTFPVPATGLTAIDVTNSGFGVVSDLTINPIPGRVQSRVKFTLTIPLIITAIDVSNNTVLGTSSLALPIDVLLRMPRTGALPATIEVISSVVTGLIISLSDSVLTANLCVSIVTKVVADVILKIPAYGYPPIRTCEEYPDDVCPGLFSQPVFPSSL